MTREAGRGRRGWPMRTWHMHAAVGCGQDCHLVGKQPLAEAAGRRWAVAAACLTKVSMSPRATAPPCTGRSPCSAPA